MKKERLMSKWSLKKPLYIDEKDKRYKRHAKQLEMDGFCDSETWALDSAISEFILPRIKRFKEVKNCYPANLTEKKWDDILNKMIFAFEWNLINDNFGDEYAKLSEKEITDNWKKYEEGMKLFAEHFRELWW